MKETKVCKYCGSGDVRKLIEHKKNGAVKVSCNICNECLYKIRSNIPLYFTKDFLYQQHIIQKKSFQQIANEINISLGKIKSWAIRFNIEEIKESKVCRYCGTSNVRKITKKGKGLNKGKVIIAEYDYCNECFYKIRKKVPLTITKEYLYEQIINLKKTFKQVAKENNIKINSIEHWCRKYKIKEIKRCKICGTFENLVERKIANQFTEKIVLFSLCKECYDLNNLETAKKVQTKITPIKRKKATEKYLQYYKDNPEKKKQEIKKKKQTWSKKPKEEIQAWIDKANETKRNKSPEEKQLRIEKMNASKKKNGTDRNYHANIGKTAQEFFIELDQKLQEQNIKYDLMQYGISENGKVIKKERCVSVRDISKVARARFLDCYIEINDRQIVLEFDDSNHNEKRFKDDLLREQEILIKKPKLEIYRIKEKYVNKNRNQVIEDLINIIQDKLSKTHFNYLNYIKLQKII